MLKRYLALFRALNAARVKYLVIGGLAAIAYGIPRSTKDADIAVLSSEKTYTKLLKVFRTLRLGAAYLTDPENSCRCFVGGAGIGFPEMLGESQCF